MVGNKTITLGMLLIDLLFRFSAVALALLLAALLGRDGLQLRQVRLGVLLMVSSAAIWLATAPQPVTLPAPFYLLVRILDIPSLILLWWFGLSLFEDEWKPNAIHWLVAGSHVIVVALFRAEEFGWVGEWARCLIPYLNSVSLILVAHLIWRVFAGRADDLVEARRNTRITLALALAAVGLVSVFGEIIFSHQSPGLSSFLRAAAGLPILVWAFFLLVRTDPYKFLFHATPSKTPSFDPKNQALHQRLQQALDVEQVFMEQGLTIGRLATKIAIPEHQLRAHINRGLGYRNFASFLNSYRLSYVKSVLSATDNARLPILTIAMDAGFASLSSFNRVFKQTEGMTPTTFRADALKTAAQN